MNLTDARDFLDKLEQEITIPCQATFRIFKPEHGVEYMSEVILIVGLYAVVNTPSGPMAYGVTEPLRDIHDKNMLDLQRHTIVAKFMNGLRKQPKDVLNELNKGNH